jgi:hypothetical protein
MQANSDRGQLRISRPRIRDLEKALKNVKNVFVKTFVMAYIVLILRSTGERQG